VTIAARLALCDKIHHISRREFSDRCTGFCATGSESGTIFQRISDSRSDIEPFQAVVEVNFSSATKAQYEPVYSCASETF